jgi:hypothetical protein
VQEHSQKFNSPKDKLAFATSSFICCWQSGSPDVKKKTRKTVFSEGIVLDTTSRTYLTSNGNSLFLAKSQLTEGSAGLKEKVPTEND